MINFNYKANFPATNQNAKQADWKKPSTKKECYQAKCDEMGDTKKKAITDYMVNMRNKQAEQANAKFEYQNNKMPLPIISLPIIILLSQSLIVVSTINNSTKTTINNTESFKNISSLMEWQQNFGHRLVELSTNVGQNRSKLLSRALRHLNSTAPTSSSVSTSKVINLVGKQLKKDYEIIKLDNSFGENGKQHKSEIVKSKKKPNLKARPNLSLDTWAKLINLRYALSSPALQIYNTSTTANGISNINKTNNSSLDNITPGSLRRAALKTIATRSFLQPMNRTFNDSAQESLSIGIVIKPDNNDNSTSVNRNGTMNNHEINNKPTTTTTTTTTISSRNDYQVESPLARGSSSYALLQLQQQQQQQHQQQQQQRNYIRDNHNLESSLPYNSAAGSNDIEHVIKVNSDQSDNSNQIEKALKMASLAAANMKQQQQGDKLKDSEQSAFWSKQKHGHQGQSEESKRRAEEEAKKMFDLGHNRHGWKNVYHKEEFAQHLKYHDIYHDKDWLHKQTKSRDEKQSQSGMKFNDSIQHDYYNKDKHGTKYDYTKGSDWKRDDDSQYGMGSSNESEDFDDNDVHGDQHQHHQQQQQPEARQGSAVKHRAMSNIGEAAPTNLIFNKTSKFDGSKENGKHVLRSRDDDADDNNIDDDLILDQMKARLNELSGDSDEEYKPLHDLSSRHHVEDIYKKTSQPNLIYHSKNQTHFNGPTTKTTNQYKTSSNGSNILYNRADDEMDNSIGGGQSIDLPDESQNSRANQQQLPDNDDEKGEDLNIRKVHRISESHRPQSASMTRDYSPLTNNSSSVGRFFVDHNIASAASKPTETRSDSDRQRNELRLKLELDLGKSLNSALGISPGKQSVLSIGNGERNLAKSATSKQIRSNTTNSQFTNSIGEQISVGPGGVINGGGGFKASQPLRSIQSTSAPPSLQPWIQQSNSQPASPKRQTQMPTSNMSQVLPDRPIFVKHLQMNGGIVVGNNLIPNDSTGGAGGPGANNALVSEEVEDLMIENQPNQFSHPSSGQLTMTGSKPSSMLGLDAFEFGKDGHQYSQQQQQQSFPAKDYMIVFGSSSNQNAQIASNPMLSKGAENQQSLHNDNNNNNHHHHHHSNPHQRHRSPLEHETDEGVLSADDQSVSANNHEAAFMMQDTNETLNPEDFMEPLRAATAAAATTRFNNLELSNHHRPGQSFQFDALTAAADMSEQEELNQASIMNNALESKLNLSDWAAAQEMASMLETNALMSMDPYQPQQQQQMQLQPKLTLSNNHNLISQDSLQQSTIEFPGSIANNPSGFMDTSLLAGPASSTTVQQVSDAASLKLPSPASLVTKPRQIITEALLHQHQQQQQQQAQSRPIIPLTSFASHITLPNILNYANSILLTHHNQQHHGLMAQPTQATATLLPSPQPQPATPSPGLSIGRLLRLPRFFEFASTMASVNQAHQQQQQQQQQNALKTTNVNSFRPITGNLQTRPATSISYDKQQQQLLTEQLAKALKAVAEQQQQQKVSFNNVAAGSDQLYMSHQVIPLHQDNRMQAVPLPDNVDIMETSATSSKQTVRKAPNYKAKMTSDKHKHQQFKRPPVGYDKQNTNQISSRRPTKNKRIRKQPDLNHRDQMLASTSNNRERFSLDPSPLNHKFPKSMNNKTTLDQSATSLTGRLAGKQQASNKWMIYDTNELLGKFNHATSPSPFQYHDQFEKTKFTTNKPTTRTFAIKPANNLSGSRTLRSASMGMQTLNSNGVMLRQPGKHYITSTMIPSSAIIATTPTLAPPTTTTRAPTINLSQRFFNGFRFG